MKSTLMERDLRPSFLCFDDFGCVNVSIYKKVATMTSMSLLLVLLQALTLYQNLLHNILEHLKMAKICRKHALCAVAVHFDQCDELLPVKIM